MTLRLDHGVQDPSQMSDTSSGEEYMPPAEKRSKHYHCKRSKEHGHKHSKRRRHKHDRTDQRPASPEEKVQSELDNMTVRHCATACTDQLAMHSL